MNNNPDLDDLKSLWQTPPQPEETSHSPEGETTPARLAQALARQHRRQRWATVLLLVTQAPVIWLGVRLWRAEGERPLVLGGVSCLLLGILGLVALMGAAIRRPEMDLTRATLDYLADQIAVLRLRRKLAKIYVRSAVAVILLGLELFFTDRFWPDQPVWHAAALGSAVAWAALVFGLIRGKAGRQDAELAALIEELERVPSNQP